MKSKHGIPGMILFAASLIALSCAPVRSLFPPTLTNTPTTTSTATNTPTLTKTYTPSPPLVPSESDLIGTRWLLVYDDSAVGHLEYYIYLLKNGVLESSYVNDRTLDNDTWKMEGEQIILSFNYAYATYTGDFTDFDTIIGTAENVTGDTWDWAAYRR